MKFRDFLLLEEDARTFDQMITDNANEVKISVKSVEETDQTIDICYNFGAGAPEGYISDKNEIASKLKVIALDVFIDFDIDTTHSMRGNTGPTTGLITYFKKR